MALSISEIAKSAQYRRDRIGGISVEDAVERARSANAFRRAAIQTCEEAARKVSA